VILAFTVPGTPQGKLRPRIVKIGGFSRLAAPKQTVSYENLVAHTAQVAMAGADLFDGPCSVTLDIVCQIPASWSQKKQLQAQLGRVLPTTKPDIDNVEKAIFDALNGVVWRDDVQVVRVMKAKRYGGVPGVTVQIEAVSAAVSEAQQVALPLLAVPAKSDNEAFFA
jgi:Holliday junction resolvase RusA-like endonuclease